VIIATALAGCTKKPTTVVSTTDSTVTSTVTATRTPSSKPFTPPPATTVAPLPPGAAPAKGEVEKRCPYIASSPDQDPNVNIADIEGDHVYRTTVLTSYQPVGCRFYFYAGPFEAIADIQPFTFASATEAHNAMVLTAQAGSEQLTDQVAPGVDGILYRTTFFGPDDKRDWACAFAKGKHLVVVHTQRDDTSRNALYIAQAVAGKF
jgi:hypothetical protein